MTPPPSPARPSSPSPAGRSSVQRLCRLLLDEGGLIASLVGSSPDGDGDDVEGSEDVNKNTAGADDRIGGLAQLAASGPRAEGSREDYELLIEAIYEGYLLHYGTPRVALTFDDDLALLAGDRLYALGLARLVALGDTEAVVELADTISLSALAQGAGEPELAEAVWAAGARAVGWGSSDSHRLAKDLAKDPTLTGVAEAIEAMRTSAAGLSASP
jgi:hypothetical protein